MIDDIPCAHSMDSEWYAVDRHGHVAIFDTGESGHVPQGANEGALLVELWRLHHAGEDESQFYRELEGRAPRLGVFYFTHNDYSHPVEPYDREGVPEKPLHVDQLPPRLRQRWKKIRFESLDFSTTERLQPLEFFRCIFWSAPVAYLCADGKTVRPVPGEEGRFAEFCRQLRAEQPDVARSLRFEMPEEEDGGEQ